jgi:hypothetical protein
VQIFGGSYQGLSVQSFVCGCKICANFGCGFCRFWMKLSEFFADFSCNYENFVLILVAIVRFVQNHVCVQPKTDSIVVHIWSKEVA